MQGSFLLRLACKVLLQEQGHCLEPFLCTMNAESAQDSQPHNTSMVTVKNTLSPFSFSLPSMPEEPHNILLALAICSFHTDLWGPRYRDEFAQICACLDAGPSLLFRSAHFRSLWTKVNNREVRWDDQCRIDPLQEMQGIAEGPPASLKRTFPPLCL